MTSIDPRTFQYLTIASALELWARHKIRANRAYTPARMIAAASSLTGKTFKPREYMEAAAALRKAVESAQRNNRALP